MRYITLRKSEEGYSASVPSLPGCFSHGDSEEEAIANIDIAIGEYLEVVAGPVDDPDLKFPFWTVVTEDTLSAAWMKQACFNEDEDSPSSIEEWVNTLPRLSEQACEELDSALRNDDLRSNDPSMWK